MSSHTAENDARRRPTIADVPCGPCAEGYDVFHECDTEMFCPCDRPALHKGAPHHPLCNRDESGRYACDPRCPGPHGGERCGYVIPPAETWGEEPEDVLLCLDGQCCLPFGHPGVCDYLYPSRNLDTRPDMEDGDADA